MIGIYQTLNIKSIVQSDNSEEVIKSIHKEMKKAYFSFFIITHHIPFINSPLIQGNPIL